MKKHLIFLTCFLGFVLFGCTSPMFTQPIEQQTNLSDLIWNEEDYYRREIETPLENAHKTVNIPYLYLHLPDISEYIEEHAFLGSEHSLIIRFTYKTTCPVYTYDVTVETPECSEYKNTEITIDFGAFENGGYKQVPINTVYSNSFTLENGDRITHQYQLESISLLLWGSDSIAFTSTERNAISNCYDAIVDNTQMLLSTKDYSDDKIAKAFE